MELALTMAWNPGSASRGMSAHHPLETALTIPWNTHAAFQRAADAHLAHYPHTKEDESKLLRSLAALKEEFGLPDLYRTEVWRPGRE